MGGAPQHASSQARAHGSADTVCVARWYTRVANSASSVASEPRGIQKAPHKITRSERASARPRARVGSPGVVRSAACRPVGPRRAPHTSSTSSRPHLVGASNRCCGAPRRGRTRHAVGLGRRVAPVRRAAGGRGRRTPAWTRSRRPAHRARAPCRRTTQAP